MKRALYVLFAVLLGIGLGFVVHAQTVTPPFTLISTVPHTACPAVAVNTTQYCFASDGLYVSLAGAAYAPVSSSGVASWNGQTGAVTFTPPVSSVNGKTGAVTITANTTLQ